MVIIIKEKNNKNRRKQEEPQNHQQEVYEDFWRSLEGDGHRSSRIHAHRREPPAHDALHHTQVAVNGTRGQQLATSSIIPLHFNCSFALKWRLNTRVETFSTAFSQRAMARHSSGQIRSSLYILHKTERRQSFTLQAGAYSASPRGSGRARGGREQSGEKKSLLFNPLTMPYFILRKLHPARNQDMTRTSVSSFL